MYNLPFTISKKFASRNDVALLHFSGGLEGFEGNFKLRCNYTFSMSLDWEVEAQSLKDKDNNLLLKNQKTKC